MNVIAFDVPAAADLETRQMVLRSKIEQAEAEQNITIGHMLMPSTYVEPDRIHIRYAFTWRPNE